MVETHNSIYTNATSLVKKINKEFQALVSSTNPQTIGVTETWFNQSSIANLESYNQFRRDRADGRIGGGVVIYVKDSLEE